MPTDTSTRSSDARPADTELPGGRATAAKLFEEHAGWPPSPHLPASVTNSGGLRVIYRGSKHGAPTVEIFDASRATLEKIRFP